MLLPNVSDVITNPDLQTAFQVVKRTLFIGEGRSETPTDTAVMQTTGVVVPAKMSVLEVLPQGTRLDQVLRLFTQADVRAGDGVSTVSDVVIFRSVRWTVFSVNHWEDYGFKEVLAVKNDLV